MDTTQYSEDADLWAGMPDLFQNRPEVITVPDTPESITDPEEAARLRHRSLVNERKDWLRANRAAVREIDAEEAAESTPEPVGPLDWSTFLTEEMPPPDWHAGRLYGQGQQITLVGEGKAGKSMFCQEMAWRDAAGLPFLGDVAYRPRRVMYVDHENGQGDIQARYVSFGATPETMVNLVYLSFPAHRPLDTEEGAADFLADVDRYKPDVVYLDTVSRVISDEENSSGPWLRLYRLVLKHLKARGITSIRLDHFGKDQERGSRGSSAKNQDIDAVWELKAADKGSSQLTLNRTFTRNGIGRGFYRIERQGELVADQWRPGKTRHVLVDAPEPEGPKPGEFIAAAAIADQLDAAGIPVHLGRDKVRPIIKANHPHIKAVNSLLDEAIKLRRKRQEGPTQDAPAPDTLDAFETATASLKRCTDCGRLPGDEWHEVNCVYRASSPEHVATVLSLPLSDVSRIRSEWDNRAA